MYRYLRNWATQNKQRCLAFVVLLVLLVIATIILYLLSFPKIAQTVSPTNVAAHITHVLEPNTIPTTDPRIMQFGLKINRIDVLAPIVADVDGINSKIYNNQLKNGVAQLKGSALPGGGGNIVLFGHSSSYLGTGAYSQIFTRLGELRAKDRIDIYYEGKDYQYAVFQRDVVDVGDQSALAKTNREQLTIITCWPVGSDVQRYVIRARLVSS